MVTFSRHALERWNERFPDMDIQETYCKTSRGGKMTKRLVKSSCDAHKSMWQGSFKGKYLRRTGDGIVFVIAPPETVVTILDYRG